MRILHVVGALNRGGAETWLVQVLHHIDREKYQMDFLVHTAAPGAYDQDVKSLGSRVVVCAGYPNPLRYAWSFVRILRQLGPYDCVHSHVHHFSGFVLMLAALSKVPIRIAQSHSDTRSVNARSSIVRKAYLALMAALIRLCSTGGIAVSQNAAAALFPASWSADPKWNIIPLGIDLAPFRGEVDPARIRRELGIPPDAIVVGHVGRFVAVKNHKFIVQIARHFCEDEPRAIFLLVGDGPLRPEIEEMVRAAGLSNRFVFTGLRSDVAAIMKGAMDCFLFPSLYEGFPLALVEAQAAGLPCVLSDAVSEEADLMPEQIWRLSLANPAKEWARAIKELVCSPRPHPTTPPPAIFPNSIAASVSHLEAYYTEIDRPRHEPNLCANGHSLLAERDK
jgi:glycosyltransferase involved in cell wall biosynthesis